MPAGAHTWIRGGSVVGPWRVRGGSRGDGAHGLCLLDPKAANVAPHTDPCDSTRVSLPLFPESRDQVQPSADPKEASGAPHPGSEPQASECVCPSGPP